MTIEKQKVSAKDADHVVAAEWAKEIEAQFNKGDNYLTSMTSSPLWGAGFPPKEDDISAFNSSPQ